MTSNIDPTFTDYAHDHLGDFFKLSKKDQRAYQVELPQSFIRVANGDRPTALVNTVSAMLAEKNPNLRSHEHSILVPLAGLAQRGLSASTQSVGGYLIGTTQQSLEFLLRAQSVLPQNGVQILTGLTSNVTWPRELGEVTFSWLKEGDPVSATAGSFGSMALTPHRLAGLVTFSKQLRIQAPMLIDELSIVLARGAMVAFEKASINGTGLFGQPTGILSTSGAGSVTLSGATTLANLADFEYQVSNANATPTAWVADPATRKKWRTVVRSANSSRYLWDDANGLRDNVLGYPGYATNVCPANTAILGDWTKMVWAIFGPGAPVEMLIDPFSLKRTEQLELQVSLYGDVGLRQPAAFCYSNGSTIQ